MLWKIYSDIAVPWWDVCYITRYVSPIKYKPLESWQYSYIKHLRDSKKIIREGRKLNNINDLVKYIQARFSESSWKIYKDLYRSLLKCEK